MKLERGACQTLWGGAGCEEHDLCKKRGYIENFGE
jgi:hypothetical protein